MRYVALLLLLSGCYTKKGALERFCRQDTVMATVMVRDTVLVPEYSVDTVFSAHTDSVFIQNDRVQVKYIRRHDTIYIEGKCLSDTIYTEKLIQVRVPVKCPEVCETTLWEKLHDVRWWLILAFLIGLSLGLYLDIRRR